MARYLTTSPVYSVTGVTTLPDLTDNLFVLLSGTTYTVTLPSIPGAIGKQLTIYKSYKQTDTITYLLN